MYNMDGRKNSLNKIVLPVLAIIALVINAAVMGVALGNIEDGSGATAIKGVMIFSIVMAVVILIIAVVTSKDKRVHSSSNNTDIMAVDSMLQMACAGDISEAGSALGNMGVLTESFGRLFTTLNAIIKDSEHLLSEMSIGNFDINTSCEESYVGDFKTIIYSMRKMNRYLSDVLTEVHGLTESIAEYSHKLTDNTELLADGSSSQLDAIEALVEAVASVSAVSEQTSSDASNASKIISEAAKNALDSQKELNELTYAIDKISESSHKINDIITTIEDIASQTNLLSLNASIEAARAGEAGRGFAVVAEQIGKLAEDSANSAVSTRELIEQTLVEIEHGSEITHKTAVVFNDIIGNLENFAEISKQSSDETKAQSETLSQINYGLEQIQFVVNMNSDYSTEISSISEDLSAKTESLKEIADKFILRD